MKREAALLATAIIILNLLLIGQGKAELLSFAPALVAGGEYWRIFTHPFIHLTLFHLIFDLTGFLILYTMMDDISASKRWSVIGISALASLAAVVLTFDQYSVSSYCGLSGIGHGMFAYICLSLVFSDRREMARSGRLNTTLVIAKVLYEGITGKVILSFLFFGMMGTPLGVCHAGGVVGGLVIALVHRWGKSVTNTTMEVRGYADSSIV